MKTDDERLELNELCNALLDGTLTPEQKSRLEHMLLASGEARQFYVRAMQLSASLCTYAAEMQTPEPDNIVRPSPSIWQWRRWVAPLAAAAVVLLGMWIGRLIMGDAQPGPGPIVEAPDAVARLSGAKDCVWVAAAAPQPGDELARGQRLDLRSGFAEVTFDSGAQLMLVGPATLDLRSEWEAELQRGTVKASVPQEAVGFRVTHATVQVVDLGTEFSINATEDGAAEVFVLKGAVEVHPRLAGGPRNKAVMRERESRRFAKIAGSGVRASEVRDSDEKFQRLMRKVMIDRIRNPLAFARWRFDETEGDLAKAENTNFGGGSFHFPGGQRWVEGKRGRAISFNGHEASKVSGHFKRGLRTVAFWVRMPQEAATGASAIIGGFPLPKGTMGSVEFAVNSHPGDGAPGALRVQGAGGWIVGSTNLLDGRWHHVAAVFTGNLRNNLKANVLLYVDGRLETPTGRHPFISRPENPPGDLWLGDESFHGLIDELVLADRPLAPYEIRHLMHRNELLSPDSYADHEPARESPEPPPAKVF